MYRLIIIFLIISAIVLIKNGFTEEFDFISYFDSVKHSMVELSKEEPVVKELLEKYKPRLFFDPDSYFPMDFYNEYLPNCVIKKADKSAETIRGPISRNILWNIHKDRRYYLDYKKSVQNALKEKNRLNTPPVYGRIYEDSLTINGKIVSLYFLKYSVVFPFSGISSKVGLLKKLGSAIISNSKGWHELDIHGSIHIVLYKETLKPFGVLLAQHNHHRSFAAGKDFKWPRNNRVRICFSSFSNEPYMMEGYSKTRYERVVGNPINIEYLFGRTNKAPIASGMDKVMSEEEGAIEINTKLEQLANNDPLYTAHICLGDKKKILYIFKSWTTEGPPGIDYYTLPELKNLAELFFFWYIDPKDDTVFKLIRKNIRSFSEFSAGPVIEHNKKRFLLQ